MSKVALFGVEIDAITMPEAVRAVNDWFTEPAPNCRFVVTPNVDHTVMLQESEAFRNVYEDADLILADGWPVVAASRIVGRPLPERVPGSDLVPRLFDSATSERPMTVYLLGAMPGVAEVAAKNIHGKWSNVEVVGLYSPPFGFEKDDAECERILKMVADAKPDVLVVGLGAPKQELWVHKHRDKIQAKAALCVGATIDFLAGEKSRAPVWIQKIGMEWFHRMVTEPRRLVKRYAKDAWVFPQMVLRELRGASRAT